MTAENVHRLNLLSRQLTEHLMSAALCAKEIDEFAHAQADDDNDGNPSAGGNGHGRNGPQAKQRPLLDEATLSVTWKGRTLHLGDTKGFWFLARLARRINQYVTHADLLGEIWYDELKDTSLLRAGVYRLRVKLRQGGMDDLAAAIIGHDCRYMLDLTETPRHRNVTAVSHQTSQP